MNALIEAIITAAAKIFISVTRYVPGKRTADDGKEELKRIDADIEKAKKDQWDIVNRDK